MIVDVYIGLADDPNFKWEGGDYNGNIPKRITPVFPYVRRTADDLHPGSPESWQNRMWDEACKDFGLELVRLDWGASGTKVNKQQILALLKRFASHARAELVKSVQALDENTEYALIIAEMPSDEED